eukprot:scaffold1710_cov120-Cylindrotheca_fusiformis.AAC.1
MIRGGSYTFPLVMGNVPSGTSETTTTDIEWRCQYNVTELNLFEESNERIMLGRNMPSTYGFEIQYRLVILLQNLIQTHPSNLQTKMIGQENNPATNRKGYTSHQSEFTTIGEPSSPPIPRQQGSNSLDVATKEEKNVFRVKILVTLILLLAVSSVATITYILVDSQERDNFESQFIGYASEVVTISREKTGQLFNALDAFSVSVSSQAAGELELQNSSWPFYRIPDWSVRAQRLAQLTGVDNPYLIFCPIVQQNEREEWEAFANAAYPILYQDAIEKEGDKGGITANEFVEKTIPFIAEVDVNSEADLAFVPASGVGDLVPLFQQYPLGFFPLIPIMAMNYNLLAYPDAAELFQITLAVNGPTVSSFNVLVGLETKADESQIMQPIYDRADTADEDRKMVGVVKFHLNWLDYFKNLFLEEESDDGIIVVLKTTCPRGNVSDQRRKSYDRFVTFQIDGSRAILLGEDDLHDTKYDSLEVTETFIDLGIDQSKVPEGLCVPSFSLHVFPSETLEMKFDTHNRAIYTSAVVIIFTFTVLVFLLYDFVVGRLQRKVMDRINKQDMIVANVFPSAIRDRLYQAQGNALQQRQMVGQSKPVVGFKSSKDKTTAAPLADFFPNTSVVFADIAGFTAWSSAREPHQVFILLETIFGALDLISNRLAIFKVETVGDCYVAAAGLPEPMQNHAVVACKFAREALQKMKEITHHMEVTLGPDTAALDLRVGIHRYN